MAQITRPGEAFDANQHEPRDPFEPIPAGWYAMQIVASEVRQNKDGRNSHLWLEFEVIEAQHPELKGRKVWERLNMWHDNPTAVDIANRTLSTICRSVGVMQVEDSHQLHSLPLAVKVKLRVEDGREPSNDVTGYDAVQARFQAQGVAGPVQQVQQPAQQPPHQPGGPQPAPAPGSAPTQQAPTNRPPWQR